MAAASDRMLIGGTRPAVVADRSIEVVDPFTGGVMTRVSDASATEVADAVTAAQTAFESTWRTTSGTDRARLMIRLAELIEDHADDLGRIESCDNGKLLRETTTQARFAARNYRFFAGLADKITGRTIPLDSWATFDYTVREPVGVAALITAWNSPLQLLANKLAPALAAGCTAVVKPSELAPLSTLRLADLVVEAGFPDGVVNVITGGATAGAALTGDARLGRISFTGSVATGQAIAAAAAQTLVPVTLELGGKSANIVFDDADVDRAVVGAVSGIFAAGGQTCIAGSRLLVQRSVYDEVVGRVAERAEAIVLGDPCDTATQMGPVASAAQLDRIMTMITRARADGSRLVTGGARPDDDRLAGGLFVQPTIFADVDPASALACTEVFGPVLAIMPYDSVEEVIETANDTVYGLASYIQAKDIQKARDVAARMRSGNVYINYPTWDAGLPFGGYKQSGNGREYAEYGLEDFLEIKGIAGYEAAE